MLSKFQLPTDIQQVLEKVSVIIPESREHLLKLIFPENSSATEVVYDVPGQGSVAEATVARCKNGISVNYVDAYMRRRDPECMVIADDKETDKTRYSARYHTDFAPLRQETLDWLAAQGELIVMPFISGNRQIGYPSLIIAPVNAAFFVAALADLQVFVAPDEIAEKIQPKAIIYVAPPFRHTHFGGKQVVVHNRLPEIHELFSSPIFNKIL